MNWRENNFYLVGIKGVGMTALAELLVDAGKKVRGSDVAEDFVTAVQLQKLAADEKITLDTGFENDLPAETEVVIFSGANGGSKNPQVLQAKRRGWLVLSHMEAVARFFNKKRGVAICGVGGKSSVSAMLAFLFEKIGEPQSYAVGVGEIKGLDAVGAWREKSDYFIVEADEYVDDPVKAKLAKENGQEITVRFLYLKPFVTVCTNLQFDHPDVYDNFAHTKKVFGDFFRNIKENGKLVVNADDAELLTLAKKITSERQDLTLLTYGENGLADLRLIKYEAENGATRAAFIYQSKEYNFTLQLPGKFNVYNALAALSVMASVGVDLEKVGATLGDYQSVKRRFELLGKKNGILFYDDYAHHPSEVAAAIAALNEWYPVDRKIIIFQSHTFSRTKQLFNEFVESFAGANEVLMTDIFPSAREAYDESVSSTLLCAAIAEKYPRISARNLENNENVAKWLEKNARAGDVVLTLGAGNVYKIFELVK